MVFLSHAIQVRENIRYGAGRYSYRSGGHRPVLLLHTVEGAVSYRVAAGHRNPPHLWYSPQRRELFQTMDLSGPAQALLTGRGFETNHRGPCFQLEIEGNARDVRFWPESFYRNLAQDVIMPLERLSRGLYGEGFLEGASTRALRYADELDGIRLATTLSPLRLNPDDWYDAHGLVGHLHVPGNDHWDPGRFDVAQLLRFVDLEALAPRELHLNPASDFVMRGNDVRRWQLLLIELGFDLSPWGADGRFGAGTDAHTREFQRQQNLEADGVVGELEVQRATAELERRAITPAFEVSTPPELVDLAPAPEHNGAGVSDPASSLEAPSHSVVRDPVPVAVGAEGGAPARPVIPWPEAEVWMQRRDPDDESAVQVIPAPESPTIDLRTPPPLVPPPVVDADPVPELPPPPAAELPPPPPAAELPPPPAAELPPPPEEPELPPPPPAPTPEAELPVAEPQRSTLRRVWDWFRSLFRRSAA